MLRSNGSLNTAIADDNNALLNGRLLIVTTNLFGDAVDGGIMRYCNEIMIPQISGVTVN